MENMEGQEISTGFQTVDTYKKPKPKSRRAKRTARPKKTVEANSFSGDDLQREVKADRQIPRVTKWVCREKVVWSHSKLPLGSVLYEPRGEDGKAVIFTVTIPDWEEPHLFDYAQGFWFPAGKKVIDPSVDRVLPRQFEPLDFGCLVDKRLVLYARRNTPVRNKFVFKVERQVDVHDMPDPEPLDLEKLVATPEDEDVLKPEDPSKTPGMSF